ncbi:MAG: T9SS type B sorting domain-containing protein [Bacteroidia bacterium]
MRFLRTLLALFLLLFTGEFCVAQSWDWVAGTSNAITPTLNYVTPNGDIYVLRNNESVLTSSADSLLSTGETLTKLDKTGKRISGGKIDIKDSRGYTQFSSIYVRDNIVYALLFANAEITIQGKTFPFADNNMNAHNIILVKFDSDCQVLEAVSLGYKSGYPSAEIIVDKDLNVFLNLSIVTNEFYELFSNLRFSNNGLDNSIILVKFDNNLKWHRVFLHKAWSNFRITAPLLDENGNIWLYTGLRPTKISIVNTQGKDVNHIQFGDNNSSFSPGRSMHLNEKGELFLYGSFYQKFTLPGGQSLQINSNFNSSILIKLKKDLSLDWHKIISTEESNVGLHGCVTSLNGEIFVSGHIYAPKSITNPLYFGDLNILEKDSGTTFFAKLNKNGNGIWVDYLKNTLTNPGFPSEIHKDDCNNIYFTGISDGEIGGADKTYNKTTLGQHSIYNRNDLGGYYFAKLNNDTLTFYAKKNCSNIQLINTSDKKIYTSFEWTFPDGSKKTGNNVILDTKEDNDTIQVTLKGLKKDGCINITTQKIGIPSLPKPTAYFTTDSFTGCQWVGMKFYDSSYTETDKEIEPSWKWDFGNGEFSTDKNPMHVFTKTGNYNISLIYCNGSKSDTFILPKTIEIIEAPKPGINTNDTMGCIPFHVNITYNPTSPVTQYLYTSTDGQTSNQPAPIFIYTKPGKYFITQNLTGPTGCVTKDSVQITVHVGYSQNTEPEILTATVTDSNHVKVSWKMNDVTANYKLIRQYGNSTQTFQFPSADTFYLDKNVNVNKAFYSYTLYGTDSCGNTKQSANKAQTILLENHSQTTEYNYLRWSPYQDWKNGVEEYKLQYKTDSQFVELAKLPGHINEYKDAQLYPSVTKQICYKIIATENGGNKQQSQSNTVCMNFLPTIIVPNAFSPNNDSINDVFSFSAIGIESYELTIYNRWGEKIYSGTEKDKGWDGKFKNALSPEGVYLYKLSAKPYVGKTIHQRGNLTLLR